MKKLQLLICGSLLLLTFESCSKDKLDPNNAKKEAVKQQSSSEQPQTQPAEPSHSCSHAGSNAPKG